MALFRIALAYKIEPDPEINVSYIIRANNFKNALDKLYVAIPALTNPNSISFSLASENTLEIN